MSHGVVKNSKNGNGAQAQDSVAERSESPTPPPDGGWGWMVVFASFMIHIVSKYLFYFCIIYLLASAGNFLCISFRDGSI